MYAGIFVLAVAVVVLVVWVSRISAALADFKQAFVIAQSKFEELDRKLSTPISRPSMVNIVTAPSNASATLSPDATGPIDLPEGFIDSSGEIDFDDIADYIAAADFDDTADFVELDSGSSDALSEAMMPIVDAQSIRQQEQMRRISRARERQAKLRQKHIEQKEAELKRKQEIARQRDEHVRKFQEQQDVLRQRAEQELAAQEAEEERLNKLRARASWSSNGTAAPRQRQRTSARLEERRQAQLRKQAEEIMQSHLGNAGETNHFDSQVDTR